MAFILGSADSATLSVIPECRAIWWFLSLSFCDFKVCEPYYFLHESPIRQPGDSLVLTASMVTYRGGIIYNVKGSV